MRLKDSKNIASLEISPSDLMKASDKKSKETRIEIPHHEEVAKVKNSPKLADSVNLNLQTEQLPEAPPTYDDVPSLPPAYGNLPYFTLHIPEEGISIPVTYQDFQNLADSIIKINNNNIVIGNDPASPTDVTN